MEAKRPANRLAILIYVMPAATDMVLGLVLFVATVRAAQMGGDALRSASVLTVWSLVYVASCAVVGRFVKPGNASRMVLAGILLLVVGCVLLSFAAAYLPMLLLVGATGVAAALFFPPFQVFMKGVDAAGGRSLTASTGIYTFSWSAGFACGPLVSGFLMQQGGPGQGWRVSFLLGAGICLVLAIIIILLNRRRAPAASEDTAPTAQPDTTYQGRPDLAWLGWVVSGVGLIAMSIIKSVFPARAIGTLNLAEGHVGTLFFAVSAVQAVVGLAMIRSRTWMYRPLPIAGFALAGLAGILCFGIADTMPLLVAGAVFFGVYSGFFYFFIVFHALVHPSKAGRYVAVNESIVGITGVLAPLAAGLTVNTFGSSAPYYAAGVLIVLVTVFQAVALLRAAKPARGHR